jgi:type IV secretory pathway VirB10-like protein
MKSHTPNPKSQFRDARKRRVGISLGVERLGFGISLGFGIWVLGLALILPGCAKASAKANPDGPPLHMPQPPPRIITAVEEPEPAPELPPAPVEAPAKPAPAPAPPPARARPEPRPDPPVEAPVVAEPRPSEPRTLRAPGDAARERAIRDRLAAASRDLARADYARLPAVRRSQYDQSRRFIQQAEQAIKDQNLTFASTLADKAATLAADLVGR